MVRRRIPGPGGDVLDQHRACFTAVTLPELGSSCRLGGYEVECAVQIRKQIRVPFAGTGIDVPHQDGPGFGAVTLPKLIMRSIGPPLDEESAIHICHLFRVDACFYKDRPGTVDSIALP